MKKIAPIATIALFTAMSFTSCKKDYKCTCKNADGSVANTYELTKVDKTTAESTCNTWNSTFQIAGGSCSL